MDEANLLLKIFITCCAFSLIQFSAADYQVRFVYDAVKNDRGPVENRKLRCQIDSDCATRLGVCISQSRTQNCTTYQWFEVFNDSSSLSILALGDRGRHEFIFRGEGPVPNAIFAYAKVIDVDWNNSNNANETTASYIGNGSRSEEVIYNRLIGMRTRDTGTSNWTDWGNMKSNDSVRIRFWVYVECSEGFEGDRCNISRAQVTTTLTIPPPALTTEPVTTVATTTTTNSTEFQLITTTLEPVTTSDMRTSTEPLATTPTTTLESRSTLVTLPKTTETYESQTTVTSVKPMSPFVIPGGSGHKDGLTIPWWVVAACAGALIGGCLAAAVTFVMARKRHSKTRRARRQDSLESRYCSINSKSTIDRSRNEYYGSRASRPPVSFAGLRKPHEISRQSSYEVVISNRNEESEFESANIQLQTIYETVDKRSESNDIYEIPAADSSEAQSMDSKTLPRDTIGPRDNDAAIDFQNKL